MCPNSHTPIDDDVVERLLAEMRQYGERGIYAAEMLETARFLLKQSVVYPRQAEAAAYCIRQAVGEIFGDTRDPERTDALLGLIVDAKDIMQTTDAVNDDMLQDLYRAVDNLKEYRCSPKPEARLKEIFRKSSGIDPEDGLIREYRRVKKKSNDLMHRVRETRTDIGKVRDHCKEVVDTLALIFLPTERLDRIGRLAELSKPQRSDLDKLRRIMKNAYGFDHFASKIDSPDWFRLMDADMLKSPSGNPPWLLRSLARHLKDEHVGEFVRLLEKEFGQWASDDVGLGELGFVGYRLGDDGLSWLVKTLQVSKEVRMKRDKKIKARLDADPPDPQLIEEIERVDGSIRNLDDYALRAFLKTEKPSLKFIELAEYLLEPDSNIGHHSRTCDIPARLVKDMERKYANRIVIILVRELSIRLTGTRWYHIPRLGSIGKTHHDHSFGVDCLVANLCGALAKAGGPDVSTQDLIRELDSLPGEIKSRFKAWLYSRAADVTPAEMGRYLVDSCRNRPPNDEDGLLLDVLNQNGHMADISDQIIRLLGRAPDTKKMSGSWRQWDISKVDRLHILWARTMRPWVELPDEWKQCLDIVGGPHEAERDSDDGQAPETSIGQEGAALPDVFDTDDPLEVAHRIASVKPDASEFPELAGGYSPASYLENAVRRNTSKWAEKPMEIVKVLLHSEYVATYFRGLADAGENLAPHAAKIISAVKFARTRQRDGGASDSSVFHHVGEHMSVDMAGMKLIKEIVKNDVGLDRDSLADVWSVANEAVVLPDTKTGEQPDYSIEYLRTVDGLPHVQAVHTLFEVIRYAKRNNAEVPSITLAKLAKATRLTGQYGVDYHACIGPQANLMYVVAPEWFEQNEQYLFGSAASAELGRVALDMCIIEYQPNAFILEKYQDGVLDAVKRDTPMALFHLLYGLLGGARGYDPDRVAKKLLDIGPEYVSKAGGWDMFDLLRRGADAEHVRRAVDFWDSVLKQSPKPEALVGFGWYASVPGIDQERWEELMMRTCKMAKKLDWSPSVAERISSSQTITDAGWWILARLFSIDIGYDKEEVAKHAMDALHKTVGVADASGLRSHLCEVLVSHGFHEAAKFR